ncbi:MAG: glycoside hydrolase family 26 protein [Bifidobacteriaceae bacterium]|jgi:hypothetical protein|nr:glycoside hydrolase family 26 protein [Bifidobacteriaceae bacterium]
MEPRRLFAALAGAALISGAICAAPAHAGDPAYTIDLDSFDSYADDAAVSAAYSRNTNGGQNSVALVASPFGDTLGNAMRLTYSFNNGYSGRSKAVSGYWPDLKQVDFWIQNDASGQDILLQLSDGASYEFHLRDFPGFDAASTGPQHLSVPISNFLRKEGTGTLDTTRITSFAIYVNQVDNGAGGQIVLDELTLGFDEAPVLPAVSIPEASVEAGSATNFVSVLNNVATVPAGGKIVQASYTSSNPAVLPNFDRLVPKGDFIADGSTTVTVDQVKLWYDSRTFTVDVDAEVTVTVSDLAPAVDVVDYLNSITGSGIVAAMHHDGSYSNPANCDSLHQRVANEFGVYPGFYGADFLTGSTVPYRQNMINEVIRQWDNGSMVQIMFHVSPPQYTVAQEQNGNWGGDQAHETLPSPNRIYSFVYNDQWEELMTDGTALNTNWKLRMDEYAGFLQQLENAGVTVMLRPFHEMQQHVFWWGGRPGLEGSAGLWRMFHDYMEIEKGLSNIVWVWNVQDLPDNYGEWGPDGDPKFQRYEGLEGGLAQYDANNWNLFNPGTDYYDILSVDFYDAEGYSYRRYEQAVAIAEADGGKPIIIGETFTFPSPATLAEQPNWTITMPWGQRTWNASNNTPEGMATYYSNSIGADGLPRFSTRNNFGSGDIEVNLEIPAFAGGLAVGFSSVSMSLSDAALSADKAWIVGSGVLPAVEVEDTRPGASVGWDATIAAGDFLSGPQQVDGKALGIAPAVVSTAEGQTVTPGAAVAAWTEGFKSPGTQFGSSPAGASRGVASLGGTLAYKVPADVAPGSYSGVLSVTVL